MNVNNNIHVIIATGEWNQDKLRYRRHRLAEYLNHLEETDEVIWVCPSTNKEKKDFNLLDNSIKEFYVPDLHNNRLFRFSRYFDLFNKGRLNDLLKYLSTKNEHKKYLWNTFPGFPYLSEQLVWNKMIYDCSDLWSTSMTNRKNIILTLREKSILSAEKRIINEANLIFCTSDFLHENVLEQNSIDPKKVITIENGVEYGLFTDPKKLNVPNNFPAFNKPVLGFIGGIKPKLDFELLYALMKAKEEWQLLLVGPDGTNGDERFKKLLTLENVTWMDKIKPEEVPAYTNQIDIGILPYKSSLYNKAVFPLKLFEFLAVGKPVLGMNLSSTKKYKKEFVYEYLDEPSVNQIENACEKLIASDNNEYREIRMNLAKEQDWDIIFRKMVEKVIE